MHPPSLRYRPQHSKAASQTARTRAPMAFGARPLRCRVKPPAPRRGRWFARFPKAAYQTEIESWRVLPDDRIEFTMRRLPSAD